MLCPYCRRMVGKDGYCPEGHLARPELEVQPPKPASAAPQPALPAAPRVAPRVPPPVAPPAAPPPDVAAAGPDAPAEPPEGSPESGSPFGAVAALGGVPPAPPPVPSEEILAGQVAPELVAGGRLSGRRIPALIVVLVLLLGAIVGVALIGRSAGASNLKLVFTAGETRTYSFEVSMRGRSGTLERGGFSVDVSLEAELTQRTGAVAKDGSATITYSIRNLHLSQSGKRIAAPPGAGASFTVRMRPDGRAETVRGEDSFGLSSVNPAAMFVSPENLVPLFPNKRIKPGQSWKIDESATIPDVGRISLHALSTFVARKQISGNDASEIHSVISVPLDIKLGHDELVKAAKRSGDSGADIPGGASFSMVGPIKMNVTQTIFTANGALQSAIGDGRMSGTITIGGIPNLGSVPVVYDISFNMTMLLKSTGTQA